jgi:hypothetical protein
MANFHRMFGGGSAKVRVCVCVCIVWEGVRVPYTHYTHPHHGDHQADVERARLKAEARTERRQAFALALKQRAETVRA